MTAATIAPLEDGIWSGLSADGFVRARFVVGETCCREAARRHQTSPLATQALARALLTTAAVPTAWKDVARISVQWSGGGPLRSVFAELRPHGTGSAVRGFVKDPAAAAWAQDPFGTQIGRGLLPGAVRLLRQAKNGAVSQGEVPLTSGEIDEDLAALFLASEQVVTRVHADVRIVPDGDKHRIDIARALVLQLLPGADENRLPTATFTLDAPPTEVLASSLGADFQLLATEPLCFLCACSRERAMSGLALVGHDALIEMIVQEGGAQVTCDMCAETYRFAPDELLSMLEGQGGDA